MAALCHRLQLVALGDAGWRSALALHADGACWSRAGLGERRGGGARAGWRWLVYSLVLDWFVARVGLRLAGWRAALLVLGGQWRRGAAVARRRACWPAAAGRRRRRDAPGSATALHGAFLLARGRPDGLLLIVAPPEAEMAVAARSFWAIALCLPAFLCLHLLDWADDGRAAGAGGGAGARSARLRHRLGRVRAAVAPAGRGARARRAVAAVHRRVELVQRGAVPDAGAAGAAVGARSCPICWSQTVVAGGDGLGAVAGVVRDPAGAGHARRSGGGAGGARFRARAVPGGAHRARRA